ncbi:MAG: CRISPR-associated protein Cas4 [Halanaerobiales bacterium]|nr:CRISPR-associated protein Cas4 [Halanaerobiales bacterium]
MFKYSDINTNRINGTVIWYYNICQREVWLISHGLEADQSNEYLEIGRLIHENSYQRKTKEVSIGNIKVDLIGKKGEKVIIGEVKKSSSFKESARLQLAFYLLTLEDLGIDAVGYIHFPKEKKKIMVELNEEIREDLKNCINGINKIIHLDIPPKAEKNKYCQKCAYQEFCWA